MAEIEKLVREKYGFDGAAAADDAKEDKKTTKSSTAKKDAVKEETPAADPDAAGMKHDRHCIRAGRQNESAGLF